MFFPGFQLESYMDEAFILKALQEVGEENVVSVKVCIGMCKSNYKLWYLCRDMRCRVGSLLFFFCTGDQEQIHR